MALRSVVLAPPPGAGAPRRTVVIRPGAPRDKGHVADVIACILGALLLLFAIVLVAVLPDKEYATPQFRVTFPDTLNEFTSRPFEFVEGADATRIHVFEYELPDNVQSITIRAEFRDDVNTSTPDQFRVELFDPQGNPMGIRQDIINGPPLDRFDPINNLTTADPSERFEVDQVSAPFTVAVAEHPSEQIVPGLSHEEVKEQVLARLVPQHRIQTAGIWTVKVTLVNAGDCPQPSQEANPAQFLLCRQERQDGVDAGNRFSLAQFVYTTVVPCVEPLGVPEPLPACATPPPPPPI